MERPRSPACVGSSRLIPSSVARVAVAQQTSSGISQGAGGGIENILFLQTIADVRNQRFRDALDQRRNPSATIKDSCSSNRPKPLFLNLPVLGGSSGSERRWP